MIRIFKVPLLVGLIFASFACSISIGGPDYPNEPIPVSSNAIDSLKKQIEDAVAVGAETGTIALEINEEQITSYVAMKLDWSGSTMLQP